MSGQLHVPTVILLYSLVKKVWASNALHLIAKRNRTTVIWPTGLKLVLLDDRWVRRDEYT